ncbi:MAG: hypothetical protein AAF802_29805, partial [Planctomycetota bacterium]
MANPYRPTGITEIRRPPKKIKRRKAIVATVFLNLTSSVVGGLVTAFFFARERNVGDDQPFLLYSLFLLFSTIFGAAGAYLGGRHIAGHVPLWA